MNLRSRYWIGGKLPVYERDEEKPARLYYCSRWWVVTWHHGWRLKAWHVHGFATTVRVGRLQIQYIHGIWHDRGKQDSDR